MDERGERVEDPDLHVAALEPDRVRERVAVDRRPDDRRVDEPDVDVRQAGLPGDRALGLAQRLALDDVDELLELGLGDRLVGALALLAVGRREALDELAGDADRRPGSAGSRPSPRPPGGRPRSCRRPRRCRRPCPTACGSGPVACGRRRGPCRGRRRRSRRRGPSRTRCRCRARCRRPAPRRSSRCRIRRQKAIQPALVKAVRIASIAWPQPVGRRCPCPGPSPAGRRPGRRSPATASWTRSPADTPRATRSSLTVTKSCGSSPSSPSAITPDPRTCRGRPSRRPSARRSTRTGRRTRRAGRPVRPLPPARRARPASAAPLRRTRPQSTPASRAARPGAPGSGPGVASAVWRAGGLGRGRERRRPCVSCHASAPAPVSASIRRIPDPMLRSPVMTKLADLAGRPAVSPAAELVASSRRPGPCGRSRRTSRRRTRRRRRRSPPASSCGSA